MNITPPGPNLSIFPSHALQDYYFSGCWTGLSVNKTRWGGANCISDMRRWFHRGCAYSLSFLRGIGNVGLEFLVYVYGYGPGGFCVVKGAGWRESWGVVSRKRKDLYADGENISVALLSGLRSCYLKMLI